MHDGGLTAFRLEKKGKVGLITDVSNLELHDQEMLKYSRRPTKVGTRRNSKQDEARKEGMMTDGLSDGGRDGKEGTPAGDPQPLVFKTYK